MWQKITRAVLLLAVVAVFYNMAGGLGFMQAKAADAAPAAGNTLHLQLKDGLVVIKMRPDLAPKHVARIKELVGQKFYDGLKFHRVIDGFMAQTGDPLGNGTGGSGKNSEDEQ